MNQIKKYFFILLLIEMFFAYAPAYAQTAAQQSTPVYSGGEQGVTAFLCTPTSNNVSGAPNGVLFACINQIYKFAIILAAVVGVFFIVIAGYIYMSADGNQESVDKAKDILVSTLTSLVILFIGYILLAAINPDLVKFNTIQAPNVTLQIPAAPTTPTAPTAGQGSVSSTVSAGAQTVLSLNGNGLTISSSSSQCPGNSPLSQIQTLVSGKQVPFDSPTGCSAGYTGVSSQMLTAFAGAANAGNNFTISAMTNGHHAATNDPHYQGLAADLVPNPANVSSQQNLINYLQSSGSASIVAIECQPNGGSEVYWPVPAQAQPNDSRCIGQPNYHVHAQWSN